MSEHRLDRIVIERPRGGLRVSCKKVKGYKKSLDRITREASEEGLLKSFVIKKKYWKSRYFSDNLAPLYRWLRSYTGQPWKIVYSELCYQLDTSTLSGQHILSHVWDFVERDVIIIDSIPYRKNARHGKRSRLDEGYWGRKGKLYVHPEIGILCIAKKQPQKKEQNRDDVIKCDRDRQYRKIDGIWYLVSLQAFPLKDQPFDILLQRKISDRQALNEYGKKVYTFHKRHCTKKEIKAIMKQIKPK
ncbi:MULTISPECIES: hypothetical protein [Spirulina sp. CCY15215]|uniref:hypothetical protein n=1 Tax=Spirulina sp. CCY15215 TaxID=2767591 RepID=UPI00194DE655|nr:hypothetical protein [Spirulina major]